MPKRKEISYYNCNDLEWIVDIFGTVQLLASIISSEIPSENFIIADMSKNEITDSDGNTIKVSRINRGDVKQGKGPPGLYFNGAHWYSLKNGKTTDSYELGYQMDQTAHFCQTFALIIFLGKDKTGKYKMIKQNYGKNIFNALEFWKDIFTNPLYTELTIFVINEIKTWNLDTREKFNSKNTFLPNDGTALDKITKQKFIKFIEYLQMYTLQNVYNGCSEG
jgi:hypothetical protein